jgi:hypothetical protein
MLQLLKTALKGDSKVIAIPQLHRDETKTGSQFHTFKTTENPYHRKTANSKQETSHIRKM